VLFLIQAGGTVLIIGQARYSIAYNYDQILPLVATALGIVGSIVIARYHARKGRAHTAAATGAHGWTVLGRYHEALTDPAVVSCSCAGCSSAGPDDQPAASLPTNRGPEGAASGTGRTHDP
jgi:hypothetical protein